MFYELDNTPAAIDPKDPIVWILIALIILCIIGWVFIEKERKEYSEKRLKNAEQIVQTMFEHFWKGTPDDELYALTETKVALFDHPDPLVGRIIRERLREWHERQQRDTASPTIEQKAHLERPTI